MTPQASVAEQLGPAAVALLKLSEQIDLDCWLDSGCLLGLVRDGRIPPWDKDVDLGVFVEDVDAFRSIVQEVAETYRLRWTEKRIDGTPYAFLLRPTEETTSIQLPIAIHVFTTEGDEAVSPQPHLLLGKGARLARLRLGLDNERSPTRTIMAIIRGFRHQPREACVVLVSSLRLRRIGSLLLRAHRRIFSTGQVVYKHPLESWPTAWLYEQFTWRYPLHHVRELERVPYDGVDVLLPADPEGFLERRYGPDWRTPAETWFYVLDDGTLIGPRPNV